MTPVEPLEPVEATSRYETLARLGRRRRRTRRAIQVAGASVSVAALVVISAWAGQGILGLNERHDRTPVSPTSAPALTAGHAYTCAATSAGALACWGANGSGQLGDGTEQQRSVPSVVPGLSGVTAAEAGSTHTCAIASTGTFCWGFNSFGEIGDGSYDRRLEPVLVDGLAGAVDVAAGSVSTCAVTEASTVECWGFPEMLGVPESTTPLPVSGASTDAVAVTASGSHTCIATSSGAMQCWGYNFHRGLGTLGDGRRRGVVDVRGLDGDVTQISAGELHTCALISDGSAWCWGRNQDGEVGDGTRGDGHRPVAVVGLPADITDVAAGERFTCALAGDGGVWCWGSQKYGELGTATPVRSSLPVPIEGLPQVIDIAVGAKHVCARATDGSLWCWGDNRMGQLGDGTRQSSALPVRVDMSGVSSPTATPTS